MKRDTVSGASRALSTWTSELRIQDLGSEVVEYSKLLLLDGIGCMLVGARGDVAAMADRAMLALIGNGAGLAVNTVRGNLVPVSVAAFLNGVALYSVGVNDIHRTSISHPGGCIIPAILSAGEWVDAPGSEVLAGMVVGYEVMGRLGAAMQPDHWDQGFHPTGTFGTFGAAAAVSRVLRLDPARTLCAYGIAGSQAGGIQAFHADGSLTMVYHAGRSAQNGVEAAVLAREGFTGPSAVLEGNHGYLSVAAKSARPEALVDGLGARLEIAATSFRPYYGCTLTIAASAAAEKIVRRHPQTARGFRSVVVRVHPDALKTIDNGNPTTLLAARLSMQFNVALVLARGSVLVGDASDEHLNDPEIRTLVDLIKVVPDPAISYWGSAVDVVLTSGVTDSVIDNNPKGDPENPLSREEVEQKFKTLVKDVIHKASAEMIVKNVLEFESGSSRALMRSIRDALHG